MSGEKEVLALLTELVQATRQMMVIVSEMSARLDRSAQVRVHVNGEVPTPPITWPVILVMPTANTNPRCGKCGIELAPIMGYVCPHGGTCPTGLGGFSC